MRPRSMNVFDGAYLTARLLSLWPALYGLLIIHPNAKPDPDEPNIAIYLIVILALPAALVALWYFASRQMNVIAKWLVTMFVAYELLAVGTGWLYGGEIEDRDLWLMATVSALDVVGILALHHPSSRAAFKAKRMFGKPDPSVFD